MHRLKLIGAVSAVALASALYLAFAADGVGPDCRSSGLALDCIAPSIHR